jgi:hypothetical protein
MLAEQFAETYRDEHRHIRDTLLALMDAFQTNDVEAIRQGVDEMTTEAGPHFYYEGETLYPALAEIYGDEYVDRLQAEHEQTLAAACELAALADLEEVSPETADYGIELIRGLLPHVSERDGLSVIVEVLNPKQVEEILAARKKAKVAKVSLHEAGKRAKHVRKGAVKGKSSRARAAARKAKPKTVKVVQKTKAPKRRAG